MTVKEMLLYLQVALKDDKDDVVDLEDAKKLVLDGLDEIFKVDKYTEVDLMVKEGIKGLDY